MFFKRNGNSIVMFARGFINSDGDINVNNIHDYAREEAHEFSNALFNESRDVARMREIVDYFADLYHEHQYAGLRRAINETCNSMSGYLVLSNLSLASKEKKKLIVYECGFISSLRRQMEDIEMYANAGLGRKEVAKEMGYKKDLCGMDLFGEYDNDPLVPGRDTYMAADSDTEKAADQIKTGSAVAGEPYATVTKVPEERRSEE